MDDRTLQAAIRGDRNARAELLRQLQDPWFRMCLSLLGDVEQARDATQEAAMRFLRDLPRFRGESQLRTWALGIAVNVVREMRRRERRPSPMPAGGDTGRDPQREAQSAEAAALLQRALGDLPDRQREAVVLRFFEDLSVQQTAAAMCCAQGTVKATVHQALRSLRRRLKATA